MTKSHHIYLFIGCNGYGFNTKKNHSNHICQRISGFSSGWMCALVSYWAKQFNEFFFNFFNSVLLLFCVRWKFFVLFFCLVYFSFVCLSLLVFFGQLKTRINLCWGGFHIICSGHNNKNHTTKRSTDWPNDSKVKMKRKAQKERKKENVTKTKQIEFRLNGFQLPKNLHSYKNDRPLITFYALPLWLLSMYVCFLVIVVFFYSFVSAWR